jgi:hypothetical protein
LLDIVNYKLVLSETILNYKIGFPDSRTPPGVPGSSFDESAGYEPNLRDTGLPNAYAIYVLYYF